MKASQRITSAAAGSAGSRDTWRSTAQIKMFKEKEIDRYIDR